MCVYTVHIRRANKFVWSEETRYECALPHRHPGSTYSMASSKLRSGSKPSMPRPEPDMAFNPMASPGLAPVCSAGMELKVAIAL